MRPVPTLIAAAFAAGTMSFAAAEVDTSHTQTTPAQIASDAPPTSFVEEPIASASKQDDRANAIVQALNADPSLKNSKITVQPGEDGSILLTGAANTIDQSKRAGDIARQANGDGTVVNVILPSGPQVVPR